MTTSTRLILVRISLLSVLAILLLSGLGPVTAATPSNKEKPLQEVRLCIPIVLDLGPLGLTASRAVAFTTLGNSVLVLPSLPYPVRILHPRPVIVDYLVNDSAPLSKLPPRKIIEITRGISSAREAAKKLKPLYYNATLIDTNPSSQKMLVLLPCSPLRGSPPPPGTAIAGVYRWKDYTVYVAPRGAGLEPRRIATLAPRSSVALVKNIEDGRVLVTYSFNAYSIVSRELPVIEPTQIGPRNSLLGEQVPPGPPSITRISPGPSYYIWDDVPWSSTELDPYNAWLGDLEGSSGIHVEGGSWSSSDTFYLPPYTVEYSVNLVIHARDYSYVEVKIWLNNSLVTDKTIALDKGEDTVLEVTESLDSPNEDLTPVAYSVSLSGSFNLDVRAVPSAKSMIDSVDEDNLVYTWRHYVVGVPDIQSMPLGSEQEWPPLEIYYGEATLLLQTPLAMVTKSPELNITLYSSANTPRSIEISLNGAIVCSGTSHQEFYKGAYRQVYHCTATWFDISPLVIESIKEGKPLLLSIKIQGASEQWYLEPGPVLVAERRARADLGAQYYQDYIKYAVASYSINSPFYKTVIVQPVSIVEYTYDTGYTENLRLLYHGIVVIDFNRPVYGSSASPVAPSLYVINGVTGSTTYSSTCSLLSWVGIIDAGMEFKALDNTPLQLRTDALMAKVIGEYGEEEQDDAISLMSFITGVASIVLSGTPSTIMGVFSLIVSSTPAYYKMSSLESSGGLSDGGTVVYINASINRIWNMDSIRTSLGLYINYVMPFGSYTWSSNALISYNVVIKLQHYCSGSSSFGYTVLDFSGSVLDPLING